MAVSRGGGTAPSGKLAEVGPGVPPSRRRPRGHRTSFPHAESREEEFVFVLQGECDAWIDGWLHRVREGDAVAFPAGTGIAHNLINNGGAEARLMVVGQRAVPGNQLFYPLHVQYSDRWGADWWHGAPRRPLGPHDGKPDRRR